MKIAVFDFDGTIYKYETFDLFMEKLKKHPKVYRKFFLKILPIYTAYKCKLLKEVEMKSRIMNHFSQALKQLSSEDINHFFSDVFQAMTNDFNTEVIDLIDYYKANDFKTVLLSGAFAPLLHIVSEHFDMDEIIGTELPIAKEPIDHIHADRKLSKLEEVFAEEEINWPASVALGDSYGDLSILERVGTAIAVTPDDQLMKVALENNWQIIK